MVSWDISYPEKGRARFGGSAALAHLRLEEDGSCTEMGLPVAVARALGKTLEGHSDWYEDGERILEELRRVEYSCCMKKAAQLVQGRDYSSAELSSKLLAAGYGQDTTAACVERLCTLGVVNDARYMEVYVRTKQAAGWGRRKIEQGLRQRGIDVDGIAGWPGDYLDAGDEQARARDLAHKRAARKGSTPEKVMRFLVGRGFSFEVAREASRQAFSE